MIKQMSVITNVSDKDLETIQNSDGDLNTLLGAIEEESGEVVEVVRNVLYDKLLTTIFYKI